MQRLISTLCFIAACTLLLTSCATVPAGNPETGYSIHGFVGENSQAAAASMTIMLLNGSTGQVLAAEQTNFFGKYAFSGLQPAHYQLKVGEIVQDVVLGPENTRRDIDLSKPGGAMNYAEKGIKDLTEQLTAAATGKAAPAGPNDPKLASQIAGTWWGYTGSTETRIGLCPDGSYADFSESGYSGKMIDQYGDQTGAWGTASNNSGQGSWAIQGNAESGTISVRYADGQTTTIEYQQCGETGCLMFDGKKLCRTSDGCE